MERVTMSLHHSSMWSRRTDLMMSSIRVRLGSPAAHSRSLPLWYCPFRAGLPALAGAHGQQHAVHVVQAVAGVRGIRECQSQPGQQRDGQPRPQAAGHLPHELGAVVLGLAAGLSISPPLFAAAVPLALALLAPTLAFLALHPVFQRRVLTALAHRAALADVPVRPFRMRPAPALSPACPIPDRVAPVRGRTRCSVRSPVLAYRTTRRSILPLPSRARSGIRGKQVRNNHEQAQRE